MTVIHTLRAPSPHKMWFYWLSHFLAAHVKWSTREALYGIFQASTDTETAFGYSLDYYSEAILELSWNSILRKWLVKIIFFHHNLGQLVIKKRIFSYEWHSGSSAYRFCLHPSPAGQFQYELGLERLFLVRLKEHPCSDTCGSGGGFCLSGCSSQTVHPRKSNLVSYDRT